MREHQAARPSSAVSTATERSVRRPLLLSFPNRPTFLAHYWQKDGEGGVFIPGQRDLAVGEAVVLEIAFAQPTMAFRLRGVVRWRRIAASAALPAGSGVAFHADDSRTHAVVLDFVAQRSLRDLAYRGRRLPVAIGVRSVANGKLHITRTENVSTGGAFIAGAEPPEVGTLVSLTLLRPRDQRAVELDGTVVWRQPQGTTPGYGVRFLKRNVSTTNSLEELVHELKLHVAS